MSESATPLPKAPPPPAGEAAYSLGPPAGPIGQKRSIGTCILLAIVTFAIYTFVWTYKTHEELKKHSGAGIGGAVGLVIYIVFSPATMFIIPSEIGAIQRRAGVPQTVKGTTGLWILLPLFGSIVWFVKVQGALNDYWGSRGAS